MHTVKGLYLSGGEDGLRIAISGWVRTVRINKNIAFIELNDGTYFRNLQVLAENGIVEDFAAASHINLGSAIKVEGKLVKTPELKQPFELHAEVIEIVGDSAPDYPLQKKRHSFEFLRTIAHLRPRTNTFYSVFKIRSITAQAIHSFFHDRGFVYVHTPIITCNDCEGAGEMFKVTTLDALNPPKQANGDIDYTKDFFGANTGLTVSGQLNVESFAMAFRNVYTFGPTFRAEHSYTPYHAAEFWMVEPEIAFADLNDDMQLAEDMVKHIINTVLAEAPEEMAFLNQFVDKTLIQRLTALAQSEFLKISYTEAIDILQKSKREFDFKVYWGCDLQREHERYLTEEHFNSPVFVTDYPKEIKAFYMRLNDDQKTVAACDMLIPGIGEMIGGSQREDRLELLEQRMVELGLDPESYWWYLELRKYGGAPHAGFGLGFERMLMYLTGMQNIRDVQPFPRTTGSAKF